MANRIADGDITPPEVYFNRRAFMRAGLLTAVVSDRPDETAHLADRLGMHAPPVEGEVDDDVRLGGVPLTSLRRADVRRLVVVSDTGATLFSGPLGTGLDITGEGAAAVERALKTTSSADILEALVEMKCDLARGFIIGRPMSLESLIKRTTLERKRSYA